MDSNLTFKVLPEGSSKGLLDLCIRGLQWNPYLSALTWKLKSTSVFRFFSRSTDASLSFWDDRIHRKNKTMCSCAAHFQVGTGCLCRGSLCLPWDADQSSRSLMIRASWRQGRQKILPDQKIKNLSALVTWNKTAAIKHSDLDSDSDNFMDPTRENSLAAHFIYKQHRRQRGANTARTLGRENSDAGFLKAEKRLRALL